MITNKDIAFAALMGIENVPTLKRLQIVQDEIGEIVLPGLPFIPFKNENSIAANDVNLNARINKADAPLSKEEQFFPLSFSFTENGQQWLFPFEPMINVSSGNSIIKRNVAKQRPEMVGTIKTRWSRKDFDIQITGALIGENLKGNAEYCYPYEDMVALFDFLKHNKEIYVFSYPLSIYGITKVVIDDYSFPFTKGENVQAFDIKATSDFAYNLLVERKSNV